MRHLRPFVLAAALGLGGAACVFRSEGGLGFAHGGESAERQETLPLGLADGEALEIELSYGDIDLRVAPGEAPHVDAHWRAQAPDVKTAQAALERYHLELRRGERSLAVHPVGEPLEVQDAVGNHRIVPSVDLTLVVPGAVRLAAKTSSGQVAARGALASCRLTSSYGNLMAKGPRGDTMLSTSSGEVQLEDIQADAVEAATQYGNVSAQGVRAARVKLTTSSGDVTLHDVEGELSVTSSYGNLELQDCTGALEATTSSGNVEVRGGGSARRKLSSGYGNISARGAAGDVEARTNSGDVGIDGADGAVVATSTYGAVTIAGRISALDASTTSGEVSVRALPGSAVKSPWRIATTYGNVEVRLPAADFSCELEASAGTGEVKCTGAASQGGKALRKLARRLNDGGQKLQVSTTSGDVRITLD